MLSSFSTALSALTADETASMLSATISRTSTRRDSRTPWSRFPIWSRSRWARQTQVGGGVGTPITLAIVLAGRDSVHGRTSGCGDPRQRILHRPGTEQRNRVYARRQFPGELRRHAGNVDRAIRAGMDRGRRSAQHQWPLGNITVPTGTLTAPIATTASTVSLNLNSTATAANGSFSTSVTAYDSLGNSQVDHLHFYPDRDAESVELYRVDPGRRAPPR